MADVFLSYARPTVNQARRLAAVLRNAGFSVWFDENLPAHRAYSDVIEEHLEEAAAVVVLWSEEASRSQWVRSEANRAREKGTLVQLRLDDARLPMPFDQIQCADLRGWSGSAKAAGLRAVVASVAALVGRERPLPKVTALRASRDRRRFVIGAGAAAMAASTGFLAWRVGRDDRPSPAARLLLQKGLDALQQNDALDTEQPGSAAQAIALLTQATEADPDNATAWGGLAMAYAVRRRAGPPADRPGLAERSRSAAERALELERNELRALAALRMLEPIYRHWLTAERARREALKLHPTFPIHIFLLSDVLGHVGRWAEATELSLKADRTRFLIPGADRKVVVNLWATGKLPEADRALEEAVNRWPEHPQVWRTRLAYLMYGGRAAEAVALLDNPERPAAIPPDLIAAARATGHALAGSGEASAAIEANLAYLKGNPASAPQVAQACAAIGHGDTALALLRGYYFGEPPWASLAPPDGDFERVTAPLFMPPMRGLWRDRQFADLLRRTGLEGYWRQARILPDFRRVA